jgi:hypothetical protein
MKFRWITLVTICLLVSASCATREVVFQDSPLQPAAVVRAKVRLDRNENSLIDLELKHVAPAAKLWPPRAVYMVWAESSEGRLFQLGQLRVNEKREGYFQGTTALERFRLIITAEDDAQPAEPSQPYMLATDYFSARRSWLP